MNINKVEILNNNDIHKTVNYIIKYKKYNQIDQNK